MSRPEMTTRRKGLKVLIAATGLIVIVGVGLLLHEYAPGNMGNGFISGAAIAILASIVMVWRTTRARSGATTFERAWTSHGDERDDAVLTRALAAVGLLALPLTGGAAVAVGLGADVMLVLFLLMVAELLTGVIAFAVTARHN